MWNGESKLSAQTTHMYIYSHTHMHILPCTHTCMLTDSKNSPYHHKSISCWVKDTAGSNH